MWREHRDQPQNMKRPGSPFPCFGITPWGEGEEWAMNAGMPLGRRKGDRGWVSAVGEQDKTVKGQELSQRINGLLSSSLFK